MRCQEGFCFEKGGCEDMMERYQKLGVRKGNIVKVLRTYDLELLMEYQGMNGWVINFWVFM